ncbi:MAG: hypothetical protein ABFS45_21150 [Pseudomonadota bacterium]
MAAHAPWILPADQIHIWCFPLRFSATVAQGRGQRLSRGVGAVAFPSIQGAPGICRLIGCSNCRAVPRVTALAYFPVVAAYITAVVAHTNKSRLAYGLAGGAMSYIAACRAMRGFSDALRADPNRTGIGMTHEEKRLF